MQLSIFDTQEVIVIPKSPLIAIDVLNVPTEQATYYKSVKEIKQFEYETKIFKCKIIIGELNGKFNHKLDYRFLTGTFEGCCYGWSIYRQEDLKDTKQETLNDCKKYLSLRMSHVPERSDTSKVMKDEIVFINKWIETLFFVE